MTTMTLAPDFSAIKGRQRQTWAAGDYHQIAFLIMPVSERLCDTVDLRAGDRDLVEAVQRFNRSDDGTLVVPSEYLEVVATTG